MTSRTYKDLLNNTSLENMNTGATEQPNYFGNTTTITGMVNKQQPLYNNQNTMQADMTLAQSNYMNPKRVL